MKKYLGLIILGASLFFAVLIFAFMAAAGVTILGTSASVYDCLDEGGVLATFIIFIVGFLAGGCLLLMDVLKMKFKYDFVIAFGSALLLLVAGILFFCTASFVGLGKLGAGAILCGIFAILASLGLCFAGALKAKIIKL